MIKHIVMFKLKENAEGKTKQETIVEAKKRLSVFAMSVTSSYFSYCSLVPRSSNYSQAHLKFCFAKGACSLLTHVLTQPDSKCLAAV